MSGRLSHVVRAWLLIGCAMFAKAQDPAAEAHAQDEARRLVKAHIAWTAMLPTHGATIEARRMPDKGSRADYRLYVTGVPPGQIYTVMTWPVSRSKPGNVMDGATLGSDGLVMCAGRTQEECGDPSKKDDPVDFLFDVAKGEPYRIAMVSAGSRATIVIVADPITAVDQGCELDVERLLPHFELAFFSGSGFAPNSEVEFSSQSYDERRPLKVMSDAKGHVQFSVLPFVAGHGKGTTTVKTVGTKCSLTLSFDWGE